MLTIFAVSDATARTAERVVRAALVQFEDVAVRLVRREQVRTPEQVRAVVREAAAQESFIVHTLVSDELRRLMLDESRSQGVDAMDLMGPLLDRLATHLKLTPQQRPGLLRQLFEARSREIEAVEFAFRHDDGQNADELGRAEIVLVGPSRTMKTPTMLYLAYRGWFAANVPLVLGLPVPPALAGLPPEQVFALFMAPERLMELRRVRARQEGIPPEPYTSAKHLQEELLYCEGLRREHGWRRIEVTGKSVEELGQQIVALLAGKDRPTPPAS